MSITVAFGVLGVAARPLGALSRKGSMASLLARRLARLSRTALGCLAYERNWAA